MGCIFCKVETGIDGDGAGRSRRWGGDGRDGREKAITKGRAACGSRSSATTPCPTPSFMPSPLEWPGWLLSVASEALVGWVPRRADSFQRLCKIGQGTYSNVYRAKDLRTGKIVALKKVRFVEGDLESIKFMAREITLLRRLDHPNIIKLEGLATSRVSSSLYLVFEYMDHDLSGLAASPGINFTLPQVKCYMKQLLSGLEHCHGQGVLHRDIKCANLLIDNQGVLKIADFGLATSFDPDHKRKMTNKVVTLWYRPPELILGATSYGPSVDLWSAGCILAELLARKPILPGRTEVEQLQMIFRLCDPLPEEYWKKSKLRRIKMERTCKFSMAETFKDFPASSLPLITTLLSTDPSGRGTASDALNSEFFTTEPRACDPESLPSYPPSKEIDARQRNEESGRKAPASPGKRRTSGSRKRTNQGNRPIRAARTPVPELNAGLRSGNMLKLRPDPRSKSDKFPPPHQDGALGFPMGSGKSFPFEAKGEKPKPRRTRRRVAPSTSSSTGGRPSRRAGNAPPISISSSSSYSMYI